MSNASNCCEILQGCGAPPTDLRPGVNNIPMYYDTCNGILYIWDGTQWNIVDGGTGVDLNNCGMGVWPKHMIAAVPLSSRDNVIYIGRAVYPGTTPVTGKVLSGNFPAGLQLLENSGALYIVGTPDTSQGPGEYQFTYELSQGTCSVTFTVAIFLTGSGASNITVVNKIQGTTTTPQAWIIGKQVDFSLEVSGLDPSRTYQVRLQVDGEWDYRTLTNFPAIVPLADGTFTSSGTSGLAVDNTVRGNVDFYWEVSADGVEWVKSNVITVNFLNPDGSDNNIQTATLTIDGRTDTVAKVIGSNFAVSVNFAGLKPDTVPDMWLKIVGAMDNRENALTGGWASSTNGKWSSDFSHSMALNYSIRGTHTYVIYVKYTNARGEQKVLETNAASINFLNPDGSAVTPTTDPRLTYTVNGSSAASVGITGNAATVAGTLVQGVPNSSTPVVLVLVNEHGETSEITFQTQTDGNGLAIVGGMVTFPNGNTFNSYLRYSYSDGGTTRVVTSNTIQIVANEGVWNYSLFQIDFKANGIQDQDDWGGDAGSSVYTAYLCHASTFTAEYEVKGARPNGQVRVDLWADYSCEGGSVYTNIGTVATVSVDGSGNASGSRTISVPSWANGPCPNLPVGLYAYMLGEPSGSETAYPKSSGAVKLNMECDDPVGP